MSNINYDYIQNYIADLIPDSEGILKEMEDYAQENNVPIITSDVASLLNILIKSSNTKKILEIGTAIGYSSIFMGKAAGSNFHITSIEKKSDMAEIAVKNIKNAGLEDNIKVIQGDASDVLKTIDDIYDMIFIDAAKGQYIEFFNGSIQNLKVGGLFICDNVLFRGMVAERSLLIRRKITIVKRLKKFLNYISNNKSLQTSIVPIGDGLSISLKLEEVAVDEQA